MYLQLHKMQQLLNTLRPVRSIFPVLMKILDKKHSVIEFACFLVFCPNGFSEKPKSKKLCYLPCSVVYVNSV